MFGVSPHPQGELFVASISQNICLYSLAPEPDCLGQLLCPSGTRVSVLALTQPQPLTLPFLHRAACTTQSQSCPGQALQPSLEKKGRKRRL